MDAVTAIVSVPAILALVNLAKGLGLGGKWSALGAVVIGVGLTAGRQYLPPDAFGTVAEGLLYGLGAAGLYDVAKPSGTLTALVSTDVVAEPEVETVQVPSPHSAARNIG